MKSQPLVLIGICFIALLFFENCGKKCPKPTNRGTNSLNDWNITEQFSDIGPAFSEDGGKITMVAGGNPASVATKTFNCGDGDNCNVTFGIVAPTGTSSGESITVKISGPNNVERTVTHHHQASNPVYLTFPTCGTYTVTVSVDPGIDPLMQEMYSVGPFYYDCRDCAIDESGAGGN